MRNFLGGVKASGRGRSEREREKGEGKHRHTTRGGGPADSHNQAGGFYMAVISCRERGVADQHELG